MFFSLVQTLVCVLLINGGLYALHLSGNGGGGGGGGGGSENRMLHALNSNQQQQQQQQQQLSHHGPPPLQQQQHKPHAGGTHRSAAIAAFDATTGRLNKEIADMAQLERERLMVLGLAKQTADSAGAPAGHHGRPIIAGRIQMQPNEELDVGDYPALLQQAARGFMFGSVVKQPPAPLPADDDYEELREFGRRPVKYDYGRVVQPADREEEQQAAAALYESQHGFGDFDDFMELESANEHGSVDDLLSDLDGYQYHGWEEDAAAARPENPYRTLEQLELNAPEALQQLFEQEQGDAPAKSHAGKMHANPNYNIRMQQKWTRKRAQSQPQLQRKIFGQHFKQQQQRNKLALANSEATASKHVNANGQGNGKAVARSGGTVPSSAAKDNEKSTGATAEEQASAALASQQQNKQQHDSPADGNNAQQQQQQQNTKESEQQLLHPNPNHKRSGSAGGYIPPVSHSIASQLMLRTARGQRQYDVPQIECPTAMDGMERFACPTPDLQGRYRCIDDHVLCDGFIDCPEGEDEDRRSCMFYKTTKAHLDVLADALLRWARGR